MKIKLKHLIRTYPLTFAAFVAVFAASLITAIFSWQVGICELAVAAVLGIIGILKTNDDFKIVRNSVVALNTALSPEENGDLKNFPLPVLIFDSADRLVWYNYPFKNEVIGAKLPRQDDVRQFTGGKGLAEIREHKSFSATVGEKEYTVFSGHINLGGKSCYALYYLDDTAQKNALHTLQAAQPAVALIAIDSVDEFYRVYKESEYAEITAAVERLTENWFSQYAGVFRKLGTGRFISVIPESELQKMIDEKFNVLEQVRSYTYNGATVGITLSAGIGRGDSLNEAENVARQALDMALGRGGDQVAVKDNDKYIFFGGVSKGVEKRTKVRTRVVASAMAELIGNASNVLIMGHKFSDLDSMGAAVGMYYAVQKLGKDVRIAVNRKSSLAQELIAYMEENGQSCFASPSVCEHFVGKDTLLIIVDTHKPGFVDAPELYEKAQNIIVIDHHRKTVDHIGNAVIFYHEPHASSACEMVTELLQYINKKPVVDAVCANALLAGIMLDTKDFVLRTGVRTFEAAAYLRARGADTVTVKRFFANSMESRKLRGQVVMSAQLYKKCAVSVADMQSDEIRIVAAQAADELLTITQVDASFVLFHTGNILNISARSMGGVNVQLIMEALGGGGHQTMAAAQLEDVSFEDGKRQLQRAIDVYYENL